MTLTPDDLAAMGERHVKSAYLNAKRHEQCRDDREPWPCDSRRLLDEVEASHREVAGLKALFMPEGVE